MKFHLHPKPKPVEHPFWNGFTVSLVVLMIAGFIMAMVRFIYGLGAVTNLSDNYPWGIWKAFNVAAGVALATGGFTVAALCHIFHRETFHPIMRPALLTGLMGYTFGAVSLGVDLGRYYNIWHPIVPTMWQVNSALFEVAICIMTYLTILYIEFIPIVCERFAGKVNLPGFWALFNRPVDSLLQFSNRVLNKVLTFIVILGVVLSCMHHSSLGSLMLIAYHKMHPLWFTPVLPLLFLLSVFAAGFAVVTCESIVSAWAFGYKQRMDILSKLSFYTLFFQGVYLIAKTTDLLVRDAQSYLWTFSYMPFMFFLEYIIGGVLPFILLLSPKVRHSALWLGTTSSMIVFGIVMNRINVFLTAYQSYYNPIKYFPSWGEIIITAGLGALFLFLYRATVAIFPIITADPPEPAPTKTLEA